VDVQSLSKLATSNGYTTISRYPDTVSTPIGDLNMHSGPSHPCDTLIISCAKLLQERQAYAVLLPTTGEIRSTSDDRVLHQLDVVNGLYQIQIPTSHYSHFHEETHLFQKKLTPWLKVHCKYGHAGVEQISKTTGRRISKPADEGCVSCGRAKSIAKNMRPKMKPTPSIPAPLRIVTTDSSGPHAPSVDTGYQYWSSFLCVDTRHGIPIFQRRRSDLSSAWIYTAKLEQKKILADIVQFKRDGAREYSDKSIMEFLENEGIMSRVTQAYNPVTNPHAERFVRTINGRARTLLDFAELPVQFWPLAVSYACTSYNNTARRYADNTWSTPAELYSGQTISLEHLPIFGSFGHSTIPKPLRDHKFSPTGTPSVYLGPVSNTLSVIFDLNSNSLHHVRDFNPLGTGYFVSKDYWQMTTLDQGSFEGEWEPETKGEQSQLDDHSQGEHAEAIEVQHCSQGEPTEEQVVDEPLDQGEQAVNHQLEQKEEVIDQGERAGGQGNESIGTGHTYYESQDDVMGDDITLVQQGKDQLLRHIDDANIPGKQFTNTCNGRPKKSIESIGKSTD
jgi:hypothetical protein